MTKVKTEGSMGVAPNASVSQPPLTLLEQEMLAVCKAAKAFTIVDCEEPGRSVFWAAAAVINKAEGRALIAREATQ